MSNTSMKESQIKMKLFFETPAPKGLYNPKRSLTKCWLTKVDWHFFLRFIG